MAGCQPLYHRGSASVWGPALGRGDLVSTPTTKGKICKCRVPGPARQAGVCERRQNAHVCLKACVSVPVGMKCDHLHEFGIRVSLMGGRHANKDPGTSGPWRPACVQGAQAPPAKHSQTSRVLAFSPPMGLGGLACSEGWQGALLTQPPLGVV